MVLLERSDFNFRGLLAADTDQAEPATSSSSCAYYHTTQDALPQTLIDDQQ